MNTLSILIALILLSVLPSPGMAAGAVDVADEDALKVAFIVNFTKFVAWPEDAGPAEQIVTVAVWDYPALQPVIEEYGDQALLKQKVRFVPLEPNCEQSFNVLYVNTKSQESVAEAISCATKTGPVLTVGESENFPDLGGMINFVPRRNTIGFELNLNAIQSQSLSISSHLIRLGTIVEGSAPSTGLISRAPLILIAYCGLWNVRR